jgi:hypothetical protein
VTERGIGTLQGPATAEVVPDDVRVTASACLSALKRFADLDWDRPARDLEWSCRTTLCSYPFGAPLLLDQPRDALDRAAALGPGRPLAAGRGAFGCLRGTGRAARRGVRRLRRPARAERMTGEAPTHRDSPPWRAMK